MTTLKKPRWIQLPLEPAAPWWELPALARCVGQWLFARAFGAEPDRPVLGISLELVVNKKQVKTYPRLETWALSLLSPKPYERKTIRTSVRQMVESGLIVLAPGGFRLLYLPESYEAFKAATVAEGGGGAGQDDPQAPANGGATVGAPSANGAPTVHSPYVNGASTVDQPSTNHTHTVCGKSAESQDPAPLKEREKEKKREREGRAHGRGLHSLTETARFFAERHEVRYQLVHELPVTWNGENLDAAQRIGTWLDQLTGELDDNVRRLLEGFFRDPWAKAKHHPLPVLAKAPESFYARRPAGDGGIGGGYLMTSAFGAPTDPNAIGPLPPPGAAE